MEESASRLRWGEICYYGVRYPRTAHLSRSDCRRRAAESENNLAVCLICVGGRHVRVHGDQEARAKEREDVKSVNHFGWVHRTVWTSEWNALPSRDELTEKSCMLYLLFSLLPAEVYETYMSTWGTIRTFVIDGDQHLPCEPMLKKRCFRVWR